MLWPDDLDKRFCWPPGTARKLARKGKLPHYILPDGSIRFLVSEVDALVKPGGPLPPTAELLRDLEGGRR